MQSFSPHHAFVERHRRRPVRFQQVLSLHVIGSTEPLQSELPGETNRRTTRKRPLTLALGTVSPALHYESTT